ncbi:MAG: acyl-CoA reductase [Flavobacteriaceae bacterium]|jgi:hypothetical protein|nr:acyl-CoA reductase [Flavobacteriaceae bacterium]
MSLEQRIKSLVGVRNILHQFIKKESLNTPTYSEFENIINLAEIRNPWFTKKNVLFAFEYWSNTLTYDNISNWLSHYPIPEHNSKTAGLILAGNIPMVGFHDCLCVLLTGYKANIKLSSKDNVLIPFFLNLWKEFCEEIEFEFVEILKEYDVVLSTGSNNTARYFEHYFKNVPHIIRKNRTGVAVLTGNETDEELLAFSNDVFTYFGLGCRNVSQIIIPRTYNMDRLFDAFLHHEDIINHNKYANNYDYNKAIYLMNKNTFWDNNFFLLKKSDELFSPVGVLYYKTNYILIPAVKLFVSRNRPKIQCVVSNEDIEDLDTIPFGQSQNPKLSDYPDGIDTLTFLLSSI